MTSHTIADALTLSSKKHLRKAADFYPTPADVTQALLNYLNLREGTHVWECACGDGDMSLVLEGNGLTVTSTDLRTDALYGINGVDFLSSEHRLRWDSWIITNPPFTHAEAFIRKALTLTPNVAMVLKSSYWHASSRTKLFKEDRPSEVLALTWRPAFLEAERGSSPLMEVVWVVWREEPLVEGLCAYDLLSRPEPHSVRKRRLSATEVINRPLIKRVRALDAM